MKTHWLGFVFFGAVGVVLGVLIWSVGYWWDTATSAGSVQAVEPQVPPPTPAVRLILPTTAPTAVEALPQMTVRLALVDAATEQPVAGDIWLSARTEDGEEYVEPELLGRGHMATISLGVDPNVFYRFDVIAPGYEAWSLELRAKSLSSRTMTLPVRLKREQGGHDV